MKTVRLLMLLLWGIYTNDTRAQRENNIWVFGDSTGLDFISGTPALIPTGSFSFVSNSAICSPDGKLLFYSGMSFGMKPLGRTFIWDSTHRIMPNSDSLIGNKFTSSDQGTTIIPFLDGSNRYYIFLQASREDRWDDEEHYLRYSVVDMDLRGGLGDVVPGYKNIIIDSFVSEKLVVTRGQGCSIWLLNHRADTMVFHAFKIDEYGIHAPVASGFPSRSSFSYYRSAYNYGNMDISTDGSRIAALYQDTLSQIRLYDFDKTTGKVSNQRIIDSTTYYDWVQLSPDGSKLYTTGPTAQFNLSLLPSLSAVKASRYILEDTVTFTGMRIGPDNKIYYIDRVLPSSLTAYDYYLHRIDFPDLAAPACGVTNLMKVPVNDYIMRCVGAPIVVPPVPDTAGMRTDTSVCFAPVAMLHAKAGYMGYTWQDGTKGPLYVATGPGKNWVRMRKGCTIWVDTFYTTARPQDTLTRRYDTTACLSSPVSLSGGAGKYYRWQDGDTGRTKSISAVGTYWVSYYGEGCTFITDTFVIKARVFDTSYRVSDTMACLSGPLLLSAPGGAEYYRWYNGSTGPEQSVTAPGNYWVIAYAACSVRIDSFYVWQKPNDSSFFKTDTVVCFARQLSIQAAAGFTSYTWSDGSTGVYNELQDEQKKWVMASAPEYCRVRIDTFRAFFIQFNLSLPLRDSICKGAGIILDAGTANASYLWQDSSTRSTLEVSKAGTYTVIVHVGPCVQASTTEIVEKQLSVSLGPDLTICQGKEVWLHTDVHDGRYRWQDGSTGSGYPVSATGEYWVEISDGQCVARDTVNIRVTRCSACISIPNAFTPNADGRNDVFRPVLECPTLRYTLKIYNRYGQEIFTTTNPVEAWNGTFRDKEQELGVYYYLIKVWFDYPGATEELLKGDISLLR